MGVDEEKKSLSALIKELRDAYQSKTCCDTGSEPGLKRIGTICLSAPVELVEAVGAIPFRILQATPEAELRGGKFLSSDSCSFCKSMLGGLDRKEVRVDAVLGATTCDQMRRNLEIIKRDLSIPVFVYNSPRTAENPAARTFALKELKRLAMEISSWAGIPIDPVRLNKVIHRRRELQRRIRSLRETNKSPFSRISGTDFFALVHLFESTSSDCFEDHLPEIEKAVIYSALKYQKESLRIALLGSCLGEGDEQIVQLIEESGRAVIVYDSICTGSRALDGDIPLPEDPYEALLTIHHDQVLCPFQLPHSRLFESVARDVERLRIQGIVYKTLKFCHHWGFEARRFKDVLGLPFLHLDHDLSPSALGQMRTRIHAFLEQLVSC